MTVAFELNGQTFTALNGGPIFKFNEAVSFQIECATQEEVDYYWERLSEGGDPEAQQCGWCQGAVAASSSSDRFSLRIDRSTAAGT
jgi:predicted 3-demethylubiquinone-9 3-methyltransferase (glyoxalase superfamily)